jgi:predicted metal-binding membrane protein
LSSVEGVLRRERTVIAAGLALLTALAWTWVWRGAGMGMSALDMTALTLFPHRHPDLGGQMHSSWLMAASMWWVMMIAMMTPSAAPLVLLYGRVLRHHAVPGAQAQVPSFSLLAGYLAVWLLFSLSAAAAQLALQHADLLSSTMLWSKSTALSAGILGAAGIYQLSPLKQACLRQCRGPAEFLTRHWRPGRSGAFLIGVTHGAYCAGCCWMLMALLFVGGVMNLVWIGAIALLVLVEKLAPGGVWLGRLAGLMLLLWALATTLA